MPQRMPPHFLLLLVLATNCALAQTRKPNQPLIRPVAGADIFRNSCAACHGTDARGHGPVSPTLKSNVPDLTRLSQRNAGVFPAIHVKNAITFGGDQLIPAHGSRHMPRWGPIFHEIEFDRDFGNVRLENLTRYLESIQRK